VVVAAVVVVAVHPLSSFISSLHTLYSASTLCAVTACTLITFMICRQSVISRLAPITEDGRVKLETEGAGAGMFTLADEACLVVPPPPFQMRK